MTAIGNLSDVAQRHLGVRVASLGVLSRDPLYAQAAGAGRTVPEAFHRSRAATQLASIAARFEAVYREHEAARHTPARAGAYA